MRNATLAVAVTRWQDPDGGVRNVMSTWFITGCSTGIGRELARAVLANADNAAVTARNPDQVQDIISGHQSTFQASTLVPRGFVVDDATSDEAGALIMVRSVAMVSGRLACGTQSRRVHSRAIAVIWLICQSPVAQFTWWCLLAVSTAMLSCAVGACSRNASTLTCLRLGRGERRGSIISCIISASRSADGLQPAWHVGS
jgi:hypothetical protein